MTSYIINLTVLAVADNHVDGFAVVFHVEPVAYIVPSPYTGRRFPSRIFLMISGISFSGSDKDRSCWSSGWWLQAFYRCRGKPSQSGRHWSLKRCTDCADRGSFFGEISFCTQRTVYFIGRYLMEANTFSPGWISVFIFSGDPCPTGCIQQVLGSQDVGLQE